YQYTPGTNYAHIQICNHVNEILRSINLQPGVGVVNLPNPDFKVALFVQLDGYIAHFTSDALFGSGLLKPKPQPLVEKAMLDGKTLAYRVPANSQTLSSSLTIPAANNGQFRHAPEYVHARHRLNADGSISDLNDPVIAPDVVA